jgi:hypothetical protein
MSAYWYVVVYVFDQFDRGYGKDTWFLLNLYLSALSVVIGLVGYVLASFIGPRARTFAFASLAGIAFAVGELLLVFALAHAAPDRDMMAQGLVGALVIGALTVFVVPAHAA